MAARALTPKQEDFCIKYVETGNASEAYRQAYDAGGMKPATINRKAIEVTRLPHIMARVHELRGDVTKTLHVTVAGLIAELEEARQEAKRRGHPAAMVTATMGKAKLAGLDKAPDGEGDDTVPDRIEVTIRDARADP